VGAIGTLQQGRYWLFPRTYNQQPQTHGGDRLRPAHQQQFRADNNGAPSSRHQGGEVRFLNKNGFGSHIHRKKPKGRAMHETMRRANNAKSKIRSRVEHVFAAQKDRMGLFIRTIGIARATTKIGMANLVYNIKRFIFLRKIGVA
jgi:hypothetical protein